MLKCHAHTWPQCYTPLTSNMWYIKTHWACTEVPVQHWRTGLPPTIPCISSSIYTCSITYTSSHQEVQWFGDKLHVHVDDAGLDVAAVEKLGSDNQHVGVLAAEVEAENDFAVIRHQHHGHGNTWSKGWTEDHCQWLYHLIVHTPRTGSSGMYKHTVHHRCSNYVCDTLLSQCKKQLWKFPQTMRHNYKYVWCII